MAQFVFQDMVNKRGLAEQFTIDSKATSTEELGNTPHRGTVRKMNEMGIPVIPHRASQITRRDYAGYDYIIGMDTWNIRNMNRILRIFYFLHIRWHYNTRFTLFERPCPNIIYPLRNFQFLYWLASLKGYTLLSDGLRYRSSNPEVAAVDDYGVVTAKKKGSAVSQRLAHLSGGCQQRVHNVLLSLTNLLLSSYTVTLQHAFCVISKKTI